jgi:hypothetical protein
VTEETSNRVSVLYSYVVKVDSGFAPNPYWGVCTLACCKPALRRSIGTTVPKNSGFADLNKMRRAQPDTIRAQNIWVIGVAGSNLTDRERRGVVFVMQVTDVLDFESYFEEYPQKRPLRDASRSASDPVWHGDAIYTGNDPATARQLTPCAHSRGDAEDADAKRHDLGGRYVLGSDHFIYFGAEARYVALEEHLHHGRGHRSQHSAETLAALESLLNGSWAGLFDDPRLGPSTEPAESAYECRETRQPKSVASSGSCFGSSKEGPAPDCAPSTVRRHGPSDSAASGEESRHTAPA